jgi:hypothetical protein
LPHRVEYAHLADYLSRLPLSATVADLIGRLEAYTGCDPEYGARLVGSLAHLSSDAEWIEGAFPLCEVLREDNRRFAPGVFLDWLTEKL